VIDLKTLARPVDFRDPSVYTFTPLDWNNPPSEEDLLHGPDPRWWLSLLSIPSQHGSIPFDLFPWMEQVADPAASGGITPREFFYKSREIGSSTFWVAVKLRTILTTPGSCLLIAADKEENAWNLIDYAKAMILSLPEDLRPGVTSWNRSEIVLSTPTWKIKALPGRDDVGRSERATELICTEMAFWGSNGKYDPEKYWSSVTGALVPGGGIVIESTANTQDDRFHDMWFDRHNGYRRHFYPWQANPLHTPEWYEQRRKDFARKDRPMYLFTREYPTTPDEGFTGSADNYFDKGGIAAGQTFVRDPIEIQQIGLEGEDPGELQIWKWPVPGVDYVIGADVAEGRGDTDRPDWSNAKVLDYRTLEHVATIHCRLPDDEYAKQLFRVGQLYNWAFLGVEKNGPGLAVLRVLQDMQYPNLYFKEEEATVRGLKTKRREPGWVTSQTTKPEIMNDLNIAIKTLALVSPDRGFWDESKNINRATLRAHGKGKDDQVLAMAVAVRMRKVYAPGLNRMRHIGQPAKGRAESKGSWLTDMPWSKR
jgi:hypothetical protein